MQCGVKTVKQFLIDFQIIKLGLTSGLHGAAEIFNAKKLSENAY